jgi:cation diffusion facilitator CzcD-associated flavoprotein CzcO
MTATTTIADIDHVDVLVVGAGISGLGAGYHLKTMLPGKDFLIVDARENLGGTWDLFRYPGIRSDSDLHTFGYEFKPWNRDNAIADGEEILAYLREMVAENGLEEHLHFGWTVTAADWSALNGRWTVRLQQPSTGNTTEITCTWLFGATGYYRHDRGHSPTFEGVEDFTGTVVHPQFWPQDLDYAGKRVVVIGSGATAVTVVPAIADDAAHVTMLQRSPSYVLPTPAKDPIANGLRRWFSEPTAYRLTRRINIARQRTIYNVSQRHPALMRRLIRWVNRRALPEDFPVDVHFNPTYNPWEERLCAVRDGDLFAAIRHGKASVVTDHIDRFTAEGIRLKSGREIPADVVVTATGLELLAFGAIELSLDGVPVDPRESVIYKSMMLSGVPNFAFAFGYTNFSWTLKVDLVCEHLCRLIEAMNRRGHDVVVPAHDDPTAELRPLLDLHSGYVQRAIGNFPQRGLSGPWTVEMQYAADYERLRNQSVIDPALRFSRVEVPSLVETMA